MSDPTPTITGLIHHPYLPPSNWAAVAPGVFKASTVMFPNVAALRARSWKSRDGYTYGLHGSPTSFTLEERLATLEGGSHCVLAPSGLAAIAMVNVALLKAGDEVLLPDNVYGPSKEMARTLLADWGVTHRFYDPMDPADLDAKIGPHTRLVWLEAPGSVTMEFPDLLGLIAVARRRGVLTALDNTWGAGLAIRAFDLGVDISMHALTKYPSGGGDVLMGSVVTCDTDLHHRILQAHMRLGIGVGANDVEFILRGLPTIELRYRAHDAAARELAQWLAGQPHISRVLHPALPGAPGHAHWKATCTLAAGLLSVLIDPQLPSARVDAFCDALKLFKMGYSWGGPVSLVVPYDLAAMRDDRTALPGHLVRFSIGLEAVADLKADLAQALQMLA
ncbi:MAG: PLP-dependent transferase [Aquabacterium sp.]